jgi:hypothetical protein
MIGATEERGAGRRTIARSVMSSGPTRYEEGQVARMINFSRPIGAERWRIRQRGEVGQLGNQRWKGLWPLHHRQDVKMKDQGAEIAIMDGERVAKPRKMLVDPIPTAVRQKEIEVGRLTRISEIID